MYRDTNSSFSPYQISSSSEFDFRFSTLLSSNLGIWGASFDHIALLTRKWCWAGCGHVRSPNHRSIGYHFWELLGLSLALVALCSCCCFCFGGGFVLCYLDSYSHICSCYFFYYFLWYYRLVHFVIFIVFHSFRYSSSSCYPHFLYLRVFDSIGAQSGSFNQMFWYSPRPCTSQSATSTCHSSPCNYLSNYSFNFIILKY